MKINQPAAAYDFSSAWARGNALYTKWTLAHHVSYPTFRVLYALHREDVLTQKEIVDCFGLTKQTVNAVVRQLRDDGYVTLEPGVVDHREKCVRLTAAGKEYAAAFLAPVLAMEERVCANIAPERLTAMHETLELYNLLFEREIANEQKDI